MDVKKLEPLAWMYHHPGEIEQGWQRYSFKPRVQSYEGMSCHEEDIGVIETPLYPADAIEAQAAEIKQLREALEPFATCCRDWISDDEDDEEWAKFRLLIKDYRRALAALEAPAI